VQRVLNITRVPRGWQTATAHASLAVPEDSRDRLFTDGNWLALLYRCRHGKVDLSKVAGDLRSSACGCRVQYPCLDQLDCHNADSNHVKDLAKMPLSTAIAFASAESARSVSAWQLDNAPWLAHCRSTEIMTRPRLMRLFLRRC